MFVHGAPIISRYTHISKTEGGANETQPHCNQLGIDVLESVIFYPFSSTWTQSFPNLTRNSRVRRSLSKKNFRHKCAKKRKKKSRSFFLSLNREEDWKKFGENYEEGESGDERDQRDSSWKKRLDPAVIEAVCGKFEGPRDETLGNHLWRGGVSRGVRTLRATDCRGTRIIEFPPVDRKSRRVSPRDRRTKLSVKPFGQPQVVVRPNNRAKISSRARSSQ